MIDNTQVDPEIAEALAKAPFPDIGAVALEDIPALRESMLNQPLPPLPTRDVVTLDVTATGNPDVVIRLITPAGVANAPRPCVYWMHGGGYMLGSALLADARLERWADELDYVVASVDYRLAPEHPHPAAIDDCWAGLAWVIAHATNLGVDPARIVIGGASAGGGLAAALGLVARDRGAVLAGQLLVYPMLDDRTGTEPSEAKALVWTHEGNALGWRAYLGPDRERVPTDAIPARVDNLTGLAPAFLAVGTLDILCPEGIAYATRLLDAGVEVELHVHPGAPHGFETRAPGAALSRRFNAQIDDWLRRTLDEPKAS